MLQNQLFLLQKQVDLERKSNARLTQHSMSERDCNVSQRDTVNDNAQDSMLKNLVDNDMAGGAGGDFGARYTHVSNLMMSQKDFTS